MRRCLVVLLVFFTITVSISGATRRRSVRHPAPGPASPLAAADAYSMSQGGTLTIAAPGVLANDTLNGAVLAAFGASTGNEQTALGGTTQTAHGGVVSLAAAGGFTYTPASAFSGTDTFKYILSNAGGRSTGTVTIEVRGAVLNAGSDAYTTPPESHLLVVAPGVLTNDTLGGGRIVSFGAAGTEQTALGATSPTQQGGVINLREDGSFWYSPPPTVEDSYGYVRVFLGLDNFAYVIRDGSVTSTGAVHVTVEDPPTSADFVVTSPGHYYAISTLSGQNPVLELKRGRTYTFQISVDSIHPFAILDAPPGSVTNNNITRGTLTFSVPATAQNYRYRCTTHGFGNVINTVP